MSEDPFVIHWLICTCQLLQFDTLLSYDYKICMLQVLYLSRMFAIWCGGIISNSLTRFFVTCKVSSDIKVMYMYIIYQKRI